VITLITIFIAILFSDSSLSTTLAAVLSLIALIVVLYSIYAPSFGNDTWRDAIQATQIIERCGLMGLTVLHEAYPLPLVSLLYAIHSMMTGLNTLWSSNVIGLLYLLLLTLWIHILAKHVNIEYSHVAVLLALTTPLIVIWSVCFIPQAYSLLMALPLLFLNLNPALIAILATALVLGHEVTALWALAILMLLALTKKILKAQPQVVNSVEVKLIIALLLFIPYTAYTMLSMVLRRAFLSVAETSQAFLREERILEAAASLQPPITAVLGVIPVTVLAALGLTVLVEGRDATIRLLAFTSLAGLGIAYVGAVAYPALDLPRYMGLPSTVILAILSPQAVQALRRRGRRGAFYALSLILLAIISFGFAGSLMPENPYTANPYATWSIYGLLRYGEAQELENLAPLLCCNSYLVDWRAGLHIAYNYIWIEPKYGGFHHPDMQATFTCAGSYGLLVTSGYLKYFNGVLVFCKSALQMSEACSPQISSFLDSKIDEISIPYTSSQIELITFGFALIPRRILSDIFLQYS
jgi:hypothetical protein